jgi:hypothetical protein
VSHFRFRSPADSRRTAPTDSPDQAGVPTPSPSGLPPVWRTRDYRPPTDGPGVPARGRSAAAAVGRR